MLGAMPDVPAAARLLITADDYGYSRRYDEGILRAAGIRAIDAAGAMVLRDPDPGPLLATGIEIGLHVEVPAEAPGSASAAERLLGEQLRRFEQLFGRPPDYLDGHHQRHAEPPLQAAVAALGAELGLRVRSVDPAHRKALRDAGAVTPDRLIGRSRPEGPLVPLQIAAVEGGGAPPSGLTEWMVHPGLPDPSSGSSYDAARQEDLDEVLRLARDEMIREWRGCI
jgi:predicted glycoside hydrolase/deacetylase ChbG (UPF0249 family)